MADIVVDSRMLRKLMVSSPEISWLYSEIKVEKKDAIFTTNLDSTGLSPITSSSPSLSFTNSDSTPSSSSSGGKISPAVLIIIVILAGVLFILHLLVRFLIKHKSSSSPSVSESNRNPELSRSDSVQRQLQQLFHLHDSGLDQAFIDALPVFLYKEIMGLKEPFDCAVCLCEFSEQDKLRLLPNCSHAFHIECIDTWLLSNSTCPLCRGTLLTPGLYTETPFVAFEDSSQEDGVVASGHKPAESDIMSGKRVFSVRLGKFKSSNESGDGKGGGETSEVGLGESSSSNLDARRCFSMGSYQYVVADSELQVALRPGRGNGSTSVRIVKERGGQNGDAVIGGDSEGKRMGLGSKGESFSVSKIWQWSRKGKSPTSSETHLGGNSSFTVDLDLPWTDRRSKGT